MEHTWHHWVHFVWLGVGVLAGFVAAALFACATRTDELERLRDYYEEHHAKHHKDAR